MDFFLQQLAELTVGYVPADLQALVRRATLLRIEDGASSVTREHFQKAMEDVPASVSFHLTVMLPFLPRKHFPLTH